MSTHRLFRFAAILVMVAMIISACAPAAAPAAQPTAAPVAQPTAVPPQPTAASKVTIKWWHITTAENQKAVWQKLADEYMAAHPNVTIEITVLENEAFKTKMTTVMQSGDVPDIFQSWGGGTMNQYAAAGLLQDITPALDADGGAWRNTFPGGQAQSWLGDTNTVLLAVFVALTWKYFGFHMLLYLTGLQNIPAEIEEAARMDGANSLQSFFYITLPLLGSTIRTSVYLSVLGSLQQFILVWIMTKGGPVNASETLSTYMYRFGFVRFQLGYGSAVAIYMFLICLVFSLIYLRLTRQPDYLTGL